MFCENCGNELVDGARFCIECGQSVSPQQSEQTQQAVSPQPPPHPYTQAYPTQPQQAEQVQETAPVPPPAPDHTQSPVYPPQPQQVEYSQHAASPQPPPYPYTQAYHTQPQQYAAPPAENYYTSGPTPPKKQKSKVALIIIIAVVVFLALLTAAYFLFIRGAIENAKKLREDPTESQTVTQLTEPAVVNTPTTTKETTTTTTTEETTTATTTTTTTPTTQVVSNELIYISSDYDSGEGIYNGEMKDGVPHGVGLFEMISGDSGLEWSYDGSWVEGEMHGDGVRMYEGYAFSGPYVDGYLNGHGEFYLNNVLLYEGDVVDGWLHGYGSLYTETALLIYEGEFEYDMLLESEEDRSIRGAEFASICMEMDEDLYYEIFDDAGTFGIPVEVWGYPLALTEQDEVGSVVLGHYGEEAYPVVLNYRYGVDEPKITEDDWITAYGVIVGLYEFVDDDGFDSFWPEVEVVYWTYMP